MIPSPAILALRVQFSSPSRLVHHSPNMTKRTGGIISSISLLMTFAFASLFYALLIAGFTLLGNIGLVMCLTGGLFDTIPITPMGGKTLYDWNKAVWAALFAASIACYAVALIIL